MNYQLLPNFGASNTGKAASIVAKVYDSTGTLQATVNSSWTEQVDGNGDATTGAYRNNVTLNTAWLPVEIRYTITGVAGVFASETVLDVGIAAGILPNAAAGSANGLWVSDGSNLRNSDNVNTTVAVTGNVGGSVLGNVNGHVGSVTGNVGGNVLGFVASGVEGDLLGNVTGSVGSVSNPASIVAGVWDALLTALTTAGSIGAKLAGAIFTGGFTGPSSVTLTFHDNLGAPVPNVEFTVLGQGSMRADSNGQAAFGINDGTYTVVANTTNTIIFPNSTLVVSGTTAKTITGAAASLPTPPTPAQTTAYGVTRDPHGNPKGSVPVTFQLINAEQTTDIYDGGEFIATSDSSGNLQVVLLKSANYRIKTASGKYDQFATSSDDTQPLPNVLGGFV